MHLKVHATLRHDHAIRKSENGNLKVGGFRAEQWEPGVPMSRDTQGEGPMPHGFHGSNRAPRSIIATPSVRVHLATVGMLFDHLAVSQVSPQKPPVWSKDLNMSSIKEKTPLPTAEQVRESSSRKTVGLILTGLRSCPVEARFRFFHEPVFGVDVVKP